MDRNCRAGFVVFVFEHARSRRFSELAKAVEMAFEDIRKLFIFYKMRRDCMDMRLGRPSVGVSNRSAKRQTFVPLFRKNAGCQVWITLTLLSRNVK